MKRIAKIVTTLDDCCSEALTRPHIVNAYSMRDSMRSQPRPHCGCNRFEVGFCDFDKAEPKRRPPVALAASQFQAVEQRQNRDLVGLDIIDVAAERLKTLAHVDLVNALVLGDADAGEGLQPILAAERAGGRIVNDAVAGTNAPQWGALAVADLHDAQLAAAPRMIGGRDRDPVVALGHHNTPQAPAPTAPAMKRASRSRSSGEKRRPSLLRRHSASSSVCAHSRSIR